MGRHLLNAGTVSPQIKWREQQRLMVVTAIQVCKSFLCVCVFTGGGGNNTCVGGTCMWVWLTCRDQRKWVSFCVCMCVGGVIHVCEGHVANM